MILYIKDSSKETITRRRMVKKGIVGLRIAWRDTYLGTILVDDLRPDPVDTIRLRSFHGTEVYIDLSHPHIIFDPKGDPFLIDAEDYETYHLIPNHDEETVELHVDA